MRREDRRLTDRHGRTEIHDSTKSCIWLAATVPSYENMEGSRRGEDERQRDLRDFFHHAHFNLKNIDTQDERIILVVQLSLA